MGRATGDSSVLWGGVLATVFPLKQALLQYTEELLCDQTARKDGLDDLSSYVCKNKNTDAFLWF